MHYSKLQYTRLRSCVYALSSLSFSFRRIAAESPRIPRGSSRIKAPRTSSLLLYTRRESYNIRLLRCSQPAFISTYSDVALRIWLSIRALCRVRYYFEFFIDSRADISTALSRSHEREPRFSMKTAREREGIYSRSVYIANGMEGE